MKIEKAIETMKYNKHLLGLPEQGEIWKECANTIACDLAIASMERDVIKKPLDTENGWLCPNCESHIYHEQQLMHCKQCGQLVSWR